MVAFSGREIVDPPIRDFLRDARVKGMGATAGAALPGLAGGVSVGAGMVFLWLVFRTGRISLRNWRQA